jgi:Exo-beta-D-glucosaminidase Ig-fold domain
VHIQLDLSNYHVDVVNTTSEALTGLSLHAQVFALDNKLLIEHEEKKDAAANALTAGFPLDPSQFLATGVVLVKLELRDASGKLLSDNLYWLTADSASYRALGRLAPANLEAKAVSSRERDNVRIRVTLTNRGNVAAIQSKLTLTNATDNSRILPAYYSDNYVSLLAGENKQIEIEYSTAAAKGAAQIGLRGWNIPAQTIPIATAK